MTSPWSDIDQLNTLEGFPSEKEENGKSVCESI